MTRVWLHLSQKLLLGTFCDGEWLLVWTRQYIWLSQPGWRGMRSSSCKRKEGTEFRTGCSWSHHCHTSRPYLLDLCWDSRNSFASKPKVLLLRMTKTVGRIQACQFRCICGTTKWPQRFLLGFDTLQRAWTSHTAGCLCFRMYRCLQPPRQSWNRVLQMCDGSLSCRTLRLVLELFGGWSGWWTHGIWGRSKQWKQEMRLPWTESLLDSWRSPDHSRWEWQSLRTNRLTLFFVLISSTV